MEQTKFVSQLHSAGVEESKSSLQQSLRMADQLCDSIQALVPQLPDNCTLESPEERRLFRLRYKQAVLQADVLAKKNGALQSAIERKNSELLDCYRQIDALKRRTFEFEEKLALHDADVQSRRHFDEQLKRQIARNFRLQEPEEDFGAFLMQLNEAHLALRTALEAIPPPQAALPAPPEFSLLGTQSSSRTATTATATATTTAGNSPDCTQILAHDPPPPTIESLEAQLATATSPTQLLASVYHQYMALYGAYLRLRAVTRSLAGETGHERQLLSLAGSPRRLSAARGSSASPDWARSGGL